MDRKIIPVEETPFLLVVDEEGTQICMGNYLMCNQKFESVDKAKEFINQNPWSLLTPAIGIIAEKVFEDLQNKEQKSE